MCNLPIQHTPLLLQGIFCGLVSRLTTHPFHGPGIGITVTKYFWPGLHHVLGGNRLSIVLHVEFSATSATASYAFDGHGHTLFSNAFLEKHHVHLDNNLPTKALCTQTWSTFGHLTKILWPGVNPAPSLPPARATTPDMEILSRLHMQVFLVVFFGKKLCLADRMAANHGNITMMLLLRLQPRRSMHKTTGAVRVSGELLTNL